MDHDLKWPSFWVYADGKLLSICPYIGNQNGFVRILELLLHGNELQNAITVSISTFQKDLMKLMFFAWHRQFSLSSAFPAMNWHFFAYRFFLGVSPRHDGGQACSGDRAVNSGKSSQPSDMAVNYRKSSNVRDRATCPEKLKRQRS
jgi:hypothetical protein